MKEKEFLDLINEIADERGFKDEYLIIIADKKGEVKSCTHIEPESGRKRCKIIKKFLKILNALYE